MKRISVVLGLAVLMAATVVLTAGAALAQASTGGTSQRIPISGEVAPEDNPCTGELVTYAGTLHNVGNTTTTPEGDLNGTNLFTFQARGVSSSGTKYVIVLNDHVAITSFDPGTGVQHTQTNHTYSNFITQGQGENFVSRSVFHITQQPDGTYSAWVELFDFQCVG
jgi:hypothetical protein